METENVQQKRTPEDEVEPKGKRGRPRKNRGDEVVLVENKSNGNGNGNGNGGRAKAKTKAEKREEKEAQQLTQPEIDVPTPKSKNVPVKKQCLKQKGDQLSPSVIGIQQLREELVNARNKGNLSDDDHSEYLKLYDDFVAAKGRPKIKKEKRTALQALYKKSVYKN